MTAPDEAFALDARGLIRWQEFPVARLVAGETPLTPRVEILPADLLEPRHRDEIRRRLQDWLDAHVARTLAPLLALREAPLTGTARGLAFALMSQLGSASRPVVAEQLAALTGPEHQALTAAGVHIGQAVVYMPALRSRESVALRALLWACARGQDPALAIANLPQGRSLPVNGAKMPAELRVIELNGAKTSHISHFDRFYYRRNIQRGRYKRSVDRSSRFGRLRDT